MQENFDKAKVEVFPHERNPKSVYLAYALYLILGTFGAHHFYLKQTYRGILYNVLFFTPFIISSLKLSHEVLQTTYMVFWGGMTLFLLVDLFTLVIQVNKFNASHFSESERMSVELE